MYPPNGQQVELLSLGADKARDGSNFCSSILLREFEYLQRQSV